MPSLIRFSQAFLVLKAHDIGVDAAFVPVILVLIHTVYAATAYPFGVLADHLDRRLQLGIGTVILIDADVILARTNSVEMQALGAALWGIQMAVTQGLLAALVATPRPIIFAVPLSGSTTWNSVWRPSSQALVPGYFGWLVVQS